MEIFKFLAQQPTTTPVPTPTHAPDAAAATAGTGGIAGYMPLLLPVAIFIFMWLFVIRPQRKEEKRKKELLTTLKKGDEVVTSSGLIGTVAAMKEDTITINVGDKTRLEFLRSHIASIREPKKSES